MNRTIRLVAVLACIFVLSFALAGCSGGGVDKSKFTGTWEIQSGSEDKLSAESVEYMKSLGLDVVLTLNADDTALLDLFGEKLDGKWEAASDKEATLTLDEGSTSKLSIQEDKLIMEDKNSTMTFAKTS